MGFFIYYYLPYFFTSARYVVLIFSTNPNEKGFISQIMDGKSVLMTSYV